MNTLLAKAFAQAISLSVEFNDNMDPIPSWLAEMAANVCVQVDVHCNVNPDFDVHAAEQQVGTNEIEKDMSSLIARLPKSNKAARSLEFLRGQGTIVRADVRISKHGNSHEFLGGGEEGGAADLLPSDGARQPGT